MANKKLSYKSLFGCDHTKPAATVFVAGEIDHWTCACGEKKHYPLEEGAGDSPTFIEGETDG